MAKKSDGDRGLAAIARGPSFERAVRLTNALRMEEKRELAEPAAADVQEMRAAIGDDPTFAKLSDANKTLLFCAMLTIRQRLKIYNDLVEFEHEEAGPLLSALNAVVATIPSHGLLTVIVDEIAADGETTGHEAWTKIFEFARMAELLREIVHRISTQPKVYDQRTVRSWRQRAEARMIRDCLVCVGVKVPQRGSDYYGGKGSPGLTLAARIVRYTSREEIRADGFKKRLHRAKGV
jgi:hypothetical protein